MTKHDNVSREGIMKATEFVKKFGLGRAVEVVDSAPESSTLVFYHFDVINNELLGPEYYRDGGSQHFDKDNKSWGFCLDPQIKVVKPHDALESLFDLKRLVESHELVEFFGSLDDAIQIYEYSKDMEILSYGGREIPTKQLGQAIADVEACQ